MFVCHVDGWATIKSQLGRVAVCSLHTSRNWSVKYWLLLELKKGKFGRMSRDVHERECTHQAAVVEPATCLLDLALIRLLSSWGGCVAFAGTEGARVLWWKEELSLLCCVIQAAAKAVRGIRVPELASVPSAEAEEYQCQTCDGRFLRYSANHGYYWLLDLSGYGFTVTGVILCYSL